jgi:hypothetical protein
MGRECDEGFWKMSWVVGPIEQSELEYLFLREPFIVSGSFPPTGFWKMCVALR